MVFELMRECNNYFVIKDYKDDYTVENGTVVLPFLTNGQYFIIKGSVFNDGIYQYPVTNMHNEEFNGVISACSVPAAFVELANKILYFINKNGEHNAFTSESFGGYSYSKAASSSGAPVSWREVFSRDLRKWRKV